MKHAAALAHIRQMCCLGLGGQAIMPALLDALHGIVASDSNGFFWADPGLAMAHFYAEKLLPPELMELYFRQFHNGGDRCTRSGFSEILRAQPDVRTPVLRADFYRSDYYNLIWRELGAHHAMYGVVREHGRPLGLLSVYRSHRDPPFTRQEESRLAALLRYVAHGLTRRNDADDDYCGGDKTGLVIFDRSGRPQHMSPQAARLLFLAAHPQINAESVGGKPGVPPALVALCRNLAATFRGEEAAPPVLHHDTPWGRFVFRAYRMESGTDESGTLIGVVIERLEPKRLLLLAHMKDLPLSSKQKEVSLALACNVKHNEIARQLNVSLNTVNYHVKAIYDKLDVHDRAEMEHKLLARAPMN